MKNQLLIKILTIILILVLIMTLALGLMAKISIIWFWIVAGLCALFAYYLKKQKS